jgi:hypothetical protein
MDKFSMKRTLNTRAAAKPAGFSGVIPKQAPARSQIRSKETPVIEPGLFIAIPIVMFAIKEGIIEREGLICIKGRDTARTDFKKPLDILKDRDEDGLISVAEIIGKKQIFQLLKKENIAVKKELSLSDLILGKGYVIDQKKLLMLFAGYVTGEDSNKLFPFAYNNMEIVKGPKGFEMAGLNGRSRTQVAATDAEWIMPDLANLPMKAAMEKLAGKTSRIKIHGSGYVMDQNPKAFEKVRGETPCVLYGRLYKQ